MKKIIGVHLIKFVNYTLLKHLQPCVIKEYFVTLTISPASIFPLCLVPIPEGGQQSISLSM